MDYKDLKIGMTVSGSRSENPEVLMQSGSGIPSKSEIRIRQMARGEKDVKLTVGCIHLNDHNGGSMFLKQNTLALEDGAICRIHGTLWIIPLENILRIKANKANRTANDILKLIDNNK